MKTINRISASAFLAAAAMTAAPAAHALGLGDVSVESYLNEPLRARIDLITQPTDDLASVTAKLASAQDYELIGASLESVPAPIRFRIEDRDGDVWIEATSNVPIREPVVRLIVEVNWSSGRMLREYTLFLDPPVAPAQAPPPPAQPAVSASKPAPEEPATIPGSVAETPAETPAEPSVLPPSGEYGPVASGETLWSIARNWSRGTGFNVNQTMIAIQRKNPDAFLRDNINLLKRGAILRMPATGDVESISRSEAYREVAAQAEALQRRAAASAASTAAPLLAEESAPLDEAPQEPVPFEPAEEAAEPAMEPEAEEPVADSAAEMAEATEEAGGEPQDLLELVPPSEADLAEGAPGADESGGAGDDADAVALRESLARTEEELINQKQRNAYLEDQLKEMQARLAEAEQGNVADADMAGMEQRLRTERQAASQAQPESKPWYSSFTAWLIGVLVLIAALVGWLFSRRSAESAADAAGETIGEIKEEAEEVLRVLEEPQREDDAREGSGATPQEGEAAGDGASPSASEGAAQPPSGEEEDAEVLDEESSDPEIQLDLARAYISMGDKEAARVILEEVVSNGSEAQQEEARKMLNLLSS